LRALGFPPVISTFSALGARSPDVLRLALGEGMRLALLGVEIGVLASFALSRIMTTLLFGITPTDAATSAPIAVLLSGIALLARSS